MKKRLPFLILCFIIFIFYFFELHHYFTFGFFKEKREQILVLRDRYPVIIPILYLAIYSLLTAISFPGATFLTLFGGFLFGQPLSTILVVLGATLGASCIFIAAKTAFREGFRKKVGPYIEKMETEFEENALNYLFFLRLVPLFPFWLVNIAPAFFKVPFKTFFITTFLGIIPGVFVYTQAGTGLGAVFDQSDRFDLSTLFNTQVKIAFIALGLVALIPIYLKKRKEND